MGQEAMFSVEDYVVFALMLLICVAIGIYFGFIRKHTNSTGKHGEEFLTGGGNLSTVPVGLSLLAGMLSSTAIIGQPSEAYLHGPQVWALGLGCFLVIPIVSYVVIPFFRELNATSAYEYFGRRFHRRVQMMASVSFTLQIVLFMAVVMYGPALALQRVTGFSNNVVLITMYLICIFYTTVGGVRAVIWTDTFQMLILFTAMVVILVLGTQEVGGIGDVLRINAEHQRKNFFNFDPDPTVRYTIWSSSIGIAALQLSLLSGNQFQIQRFSSVPSIKEARKLVWIYAFGWFFITLMTVYTGMLIFAKFVDCDPVTNKQISKPDEIFPLFVMSVIGSYRGVPGLFVSGIFSASLSTVSTGLNSLAAIWFAELEGTQFKKSLSATKATITVKALALLFGLVSFSAVYVVSYLGSLTQTSVVLNGAVPGSLTGVFFLGIYVPFAEAWGVSFGLFSSVAVIGWLFFGTQLAARSGFAIHDVLPLSTEGCSANMTTATFATPKPLAFAPYRISFLWYTLIAFAVTVTSGALVSLLVKFITKFRVVQNTALNKKTARSAISPESHEMEVLDGLLEKA